jgi:hypothetical protein
VLPPMVGSRMIMADTVMVPRTECGPVSHRGPCPLPKGQGGQDRAPNEGRAASPTEAPVLTRREPVLRSALRNSETGPVINLMPRPPEARLYGAKFYGVNRRCQRQHIDFAMGN